MNETYFNFWPKNLATSGEMPQQTCLDMTKIKMQLQKAFGPLI